MKKLYRSERDKKITGLCGGLARWLNIDASIIRLVAVAAVLFSFGSVLLFYIIGSLIVPKETYDGFNDPYGIY
ncbi:PspC domain-containing protein ['Paenibacillus yunnanensis' Narsing Rao et al. 2020]|uniref:PspC domain-containing protein n=1 Tax=Paenibacillus tengchongensis TaxID=2608684 RepID=UPI00124EC637|nr:PspC domain-containing protein [Paenibacillus tengchongensis]